MADNNVLMRRSMGSPAPGNSQRMPMEALLKLVKANNAVRLEPELSQGSYTPQELHVLLFNACYKDRKSVVDMLIDQPCYTSRVLAGIVVDALASMQAEFAFYLLGHQAFRERALNAALHDAAGRKDDGDLEALINALIKAGADTGSRNEAGKTALEIARSAGYVSDEIARLLQTTDTPDSGLATGFSYASSPSVLPSEIMNICLDNLSALDRRTVGAASQTCQKFYLQLLEKRKDAQAIYRAEKLGSLPIARRAGQFAELIGSLEKQSASSKFARASPDKALILCSLIRQIRHLDKGEVREHAYKRALNACLAMPSDNRLLLELARTLDCLPKHERDGASKMLIEAARGLKYPDETMQLLTLRCRAMAVCCMHNTMDLEPRFESLARDCISLPEQSRLDITLDFIRLLSANKDEIAQDKGWNPLASVIKRLAIAEKAIALLDLASHLTKFPRRDFPWVGIFEWFIRQASTLPHSDNIRLCNRLLDKIRVLRADARAQIFKSMAKNARSFPEENRTALLLELSSRMKIVPDQYRRRESWFRWLVKESSTLAHESRRRLLADLCCRLDQLDHEPRTDAYMLIVGNMVGLPAAEQFELMNKKGLLAKLHDLPEYATLAAFSALADVVRGMPDQQRKAIVRYMTSDECLCIVPASPARDRVCAALRDSVKQG